MISGDVSPGTRESVRQALQGSIPSKSSIAAAQIEKEIWNWAQSPKKNEDEERDEEGAGQEEEKRNPPPCARLYQFKAKQLIYNLRQNAPLFHQYTPEELVVLDDFLLAGLDTPRAKTTRLSIDALQGILENEDGDAELDDAEREAITGHALVICRKCKGTDIQWDLKQVRGADEAMTQFFSCKTCGSRWKS